MLCFITNYSFGKVVPVLTFKEQNIRLKYVVLSVIKLSFSTNTRALEVCSNWIKNWVIRFHPAIRFHPIFSYFLRSITNCLLKSSVLRMQTSYIRNRFNFTTEWVFLIFVVIQRLARIKITEKKIWKCLFRIIFTPNYTILKNKIMSKIRTIMNKK